MNAETARVHVERVYGRAVLFTHGKESWRARPSALGARPQIGRAVTTALRAKRAKRIPLRVTFNRKRLSGYVARLDNRLSEPASDAYLAGLYNLMPVIEPGQPGMSVNRGMMMGRVVTTLRSFHRRAHRAGGRGGRAAGHAGQLRTGHRDRDQVERASSTTGARACRARSRWRPGSPRTRRRSGSGRSSTMRRDPWWIPPPDSTVGAGRQADPARAGEPAGHALDGHLRAVRRHPRHARCGLARLLAVARLHPHGDSRRGVGSSTTSSRHSGLHRRCLSASSPRAT